MKRQEEIKQELDRLKEEKKWDELLQLSTQTIEDFPEWHYGFFRRATAKQALEDYTGALEDNNRAIELNPDDADACGNRAITKDSLKDFEGALMDYHRAIELNPNDADAYYNRAITKSNLKDFEGALMDYDRAIELNPEYAIAYNNRANTKFSLKDFEGALMDYNRAIELNPNDAMPYNNRANTKDSLKDFEGALMDYNRAIELNPNDAMPYNNRANTKDSLKDFEGALMDYNRAIELNPDDAYAYYNRAITKSNLKDFEGALMDYNRAIELNPDDAIAYNNRANTKFNLKDFEGALRDYDRAIELNPEYTIAYNNRANTKFDLNDFEGALMDYNRAIELNPDDADTYYNRAFTKKSLNDFEGALMDYNRAIELEPDNAYKYYNRAITKSILNDFEGALMDYNCAIELNSDDADAYVNRAFTKSNLNDFEGALMDYNRAIELEPDNAGIYWKRASFNQRLDNFKAALIDYNRAIELEPNNANIYADRALTKSNLNDINGALADYNASLSIDPRLIGVYFGRANVKSELGDYAGASIDYARVGRIRTSVKVICKEILSKIGFNFLYGITRNYYTSDFYAVAGQTLLIGILLHKNQSEKKQTVYPFLHELWKMRIAVKKNINKLCKKEGRSSHKNMIKAVLFLWGTPTNIVNLRKIANRVEVQIVCIDQNQSVESVQNQLFLEDVEIKKEDAVAFEKLAITAAQQIDSKDIHHKVFERYPDFDYNSLVDCYTEMIELNPDDASLLFQRGEIERNENHLEKAKTFYHRALQIDPNLRICIESLANVETLLGNDEIASQLKEKLKEIKDHIQPPSLTKDNDLQRDLKFSPSKKHLTLNDFQGIIENNKEVNKDDYKALLEITAKSKLYARNFSHNIGSHVLSRISQDPNAVKERLTELLSVTHIPIKEEEKMQYVICALNKLMRYILLRHEFLANTEQESKNYQFMQDLFLPFVENILLMDNIAASEGLHYYNNLNSKLQISVYYNRDGKKYKLLTNYYKNNKRIHSFPLLTSDEKIEEGYGNTYPFYNRFGEVALEECSVKITAHKLLSTSEEMHEEWDPTPTEEINPNFSVSIPTPHVFYSILENWIRNASKHNQARLNDPNKKLKIRIDIFDEPDEPEYTLRLDDNISCIDSSLFPDFLQEINNLTSTKSYTDSKYLGIAEIKSNTSLLSLGKEKNNLTVEQSLRPYKDVNLTRFSFVFKIPKVKKVVIVGPETDKSLPEEIMYIQKENIENVNGSEFLIILDNSFNPYLDKYLCLFPFRTIIVGSEDKYKKQTNYIPNRFAFVDSVDSVDFVDFIQLEDTISVQKWCWEVWLTRWNVKKETHCLLVNNDQLDWRKKLDNGILDNYPFELITTTTSKLEGKLNNYNRMVVYDRHSKLGEDCFFKDYLTSNPEAEISYLILSGKNRDFSTISYSSCDEEAILLPYQLMEAGLMRVMIVDERILEEAKKDTINTGSNTAILKHFQLPQNIFAAYWAANVKFCTCMTTTGNHLVFGKEPESFEDFLKMNIGANYQVTFHARLRTYNTTKLCKLIEQHVDLRPFIVEKTPITVEKTEEIIEECRKYLRDKKFKNEGLSDLENEINRMVALYNPNIKPVESTTLDFDAIIIHRTFVNGSKTGIMPDDFIKYIRKKIPMVILDSGGGILNGIDSGVNFIPYSDVNHCFLNQEVAKLTLCKHINMSSQSKK